MTATTTIRTLSSLDKDLTALGEVYINAFGDLLTAQRKEPEPRLSLPERYGSQGLRLARMIRHGAIAWKAVAADGKAVGFIFLNPPGWRNTIVSEEEAKTQTFAGYDIQYYNWFTEDMQKARDKLMGDQQYWYLRILAVHPAYQRQGIGSQLINTLLSYIQTSDKADLPVVVEPTKAGEATYRARGFTYKAPIKYTSDMPDGQVWVKPGMQK